MLTRDSDPRLLSRVLPPAAFVLGVCCFAWTAFHVWSFALDDAWITLRYARHLASGLGAVYNPGEADEGYSSPLLVLLLAVPHLLHVDAFLAAKWLGVIATLAAAALMLTWPAEHPERPRMASAVAAGLWLAVPRTALHAVSAMETGLASLLVVVLFRLSAERERVAERAWPLGACAMLGGLTRPEFHLLAGVTFVALALRTDRAGRTALLVAGLSCWIMPTLLLESLRIGFYHQHLPLPFYVKSITAGQLPGLPHAVAWWSSVTRNLGLLIVPGLLPPPQTLWVPWAATLVVMAALTPFQPIMAPELRYLWPLAPVAALSAGHGFERLWGWCARGPGAAWTRFALAVLPLVLMVRLALIGSSLLAVDLEYARAVNAAHLQLGREMAAVATRELRLATSDAGVVPYLTDAWTLDLAGLNSARVARQGQRTPHDVFDGDHVNALVLVSSEPEEFRAQPWSTYEAALAAEAQRRGWQRVALRRFNAGYWLWVLVPPGSKLTALRPGP